MSLIDTSLKEQRVVAVLRQLGSALGENSLALLDHWKADRRAVGVINPACPELLAYIAAVDPENYDVHLEIEATSPASYLPRRTVAIFQGLESTSVSWIVGKFLRIKDGCPWIAALTTIPLATGLGLVADMSHYPAVIERAISGFGVFFPDIPGCTSFGDTLAEAVGNAAVALNAHLELDAQQGDMPPELSNLDALHVDPDIDEAARVLIRVARPPSPEAP